MLTVVPLLGGRIVKASEVGSGAGAGVDRRGGNLLLPVRYFGGPQLFLDLHLELIAGASEFEHQLAQLPPDLRQFLGAKNNQGQSENEDSVGQTHRSVMIPSPPSGHKSPRLADFSGQSGCITIRDSRRSDR